MTNVSSSSHDQTGGGANFQSKVFTNTDLVGGVYTLAHGMGRFVDIHVVNPAGSPVEMSALDITHNATYTSADIDFGGAIGAGNWVAYWR